MSAALDEDPQKVFVISDGKPMVREDGRSLPQGAILAKISGTLSECATRPEIQAIDTRTAGGADDHSRGEFLQRLVNEFRNRRQATATECD